MYNIVHSWMVLCLLSHPLPVHVHSRHNDPCPQLSPPFLVYVHSLMVLWFFGFICDRENIIFIKNLCFFLGGKMTRWGDPRQTYATIRQSHLILLFRLKEGNIIIKTLFYLGRGGRGAMYPKLIYIVWGSLNALPVFVNVLSPCLLTPWRSGLLERTPFLLVPCRLWGVVTNGWIFILILIIIIYLFISFFVSLNKLAFLFS